MTVPDRIGRYRPTGLLGTGGFATVYRATDDRVGGEVAIKVLAENHSLDLDVRERFVSEGRLLRRIDSHHVVTVLDAGETDRHQPFLVLELADRGDLADRVTSRRAAGWRPGRDDVTAVATWVSDAVEAVHRAGAVHRDLSPGNLLLRSTVAPEALPCPLLDRDERLLLADLGLGKDLAAGSGYTVAGGTQGFRPPEQRGGPARVDARADLWALSALIVWLVTGAPPDDRDPTDAVIAAGLPAALGRALGRSLADDPAARHPDVDAWRDEVTASVAAADGPVATPGRVAPSRSVRVRLRTLVATLVLGLLLGVAGTWLLTGDGQRVERLGDGQVAVQATAGDAELTLTGPAAVEAGRTARFGVAGTQVAGWVWLGPDGRLHADVPGLEVRTTSPGTAEIRVVAVTVDGRNIEVVHRLRVTGGR